MMSAEINLTVRTMTTSADRVSSEPHLMIRAFHHICASPRRAAIAALLAQAVIALLMLAPSVAPPAHAAKPERIVSINLCADQILLDLVPRSRIRALSHLAADPSVSAAHEAARGIPSTRGEAEDVLRLDPDLVIAGAYSTPATVPLLERVGRRVVKVPLANTLDEIRALVRTMAAAVEERERGEAILSAFDRRLGAARERATDRAGPRPSALNYQINGYASGTGSLMDAALEVAGFANHAGALGLGAGGALSLEALLARPPDLLLLSGAVDEYRTAVADNLRHPALAKLREQTPSLVLPWRTWLCGTPRVTDAIDRLIEARSLVSPQKDRAR